jgi:thiol-disulfide isomerase/thioredoxin
MVARLPRLAVIAVLALSAVGAGAAVYGTLQPGGNSESAACRASTEAVKRIAPLAKGEVAALGVTDPAKPAPNPTFKDPAGQPVSLADFKGKAVLLNLWATWCLPCRHEMPALDRLQARLGGPAFEVVAVNIDTRNLDRPQAWLKETGIERLAYYHDHEAKIFQTLQRTGHVVGLPTTLLIDAQGCELAVLKGPADWGSDDAVALIRAALER